MLTKKIKTVKLFTQDEEKEISKDINTKGVGPSGKGNWLSTSLLWVRIPSHPPKNGWIAQLVEQATDNR